MRDSLFRPQAISSSLTTSFGDRMFYQPLRLSVMVVFIAVVFMAFLAFCLLVPLTQTERVRGFVTPSQGEIKVYSARPGVLAKIYVAEGVPVMRGDVLAALIEPGFDAEGTQATESLLQYVDQQIAQLSQRMGLLEEHNIQVRAQLAARVAALHTESQLLWEEHEVVRQRLQISEQDYSGNLSLYQKEAISQHEYNQARMSWSHIQQQAKASRLTAENRTAAWQEAKQQLVMRPTVEAQEQLELQSALSQLRQRREELRIQGQFTITAPIDGIVGQLIGTVGEPLDPRVPFITLVPEEQGLEARLYLPSRAMADVAIGQRVLLAYDAYPYQRYGMFEAVLESLAPVPLDPREHSLPLELYEPVYLARARLVEQTIRGAGQLDEQPLRSGMLLSADIITGKQTLIQKILGPLTTLRSRL